MTNINVVEVSFGEGRRALDTTKNIIEMTYEQLKLNPTDKVLRRIYNNAVADFVATKDTWRNYYGKEITSKGM